MRKPLLFFTLLLSFSIANGQITLTGSDHRPSIGDLYEFDVVNNPSIDVSHNGANQTWDLSSLSGNLTDHEFTDLASSSNPGSYPNTDIVEVVGGNSAELYMISNSSEWSLEGMFIPGQVKVIFTDKREILQFPMDYGDQINETFSGTAENLSVGQTYDRGGTVDVEVDGYGSLILPYATIDNVLRVRSVMDYSDEQSGTTVATYIDTVYRWFNATTNIRIASRSLGYINGSQQLSQASYMSQSDISTALKEEDIEWTAFSVNPNPVQEDLNIQLPERAREDEEIRILDMTGKTLKKIDPSGSRKIRLDVSDLPRGVHFIEYRNAEESRVEKLIVQ